MVVHSFHHNEMAFHHNEVVINPLYIDVMATTSLVHVPEIPRENKWKGVRGSGNDPDANPELLMDISEVVNASGDVLSTQAQPGEALPLSPGESKTQVEKEASEILQDTTSTEAVKAASQEAPIKDTL
ncbi:hypothetical protein HPB47_025262 [Ixodes persulcatus]|uniref:Uncharacterized protein n=1 Tax=Ixodes persulcatus TaxID=34615 RepID=A0AC60QZG1_IXOPE|nr:hypothetical protein HPB47_025262 [Ixodes persulcatus]